MKLKLHLKQVKEHSPDFQTLKQHINFLFAKTDNSFFILFLNNVFHYVIMFLLCFIVLVKAEIHYTTFKI